MFTFLDVNFTNLKPEVFLSDNMTAIVLPGGDQIASLVTMAVWKRLSIHK